MVAPGRGVAEATAGGAVAVLVVINYMFFSPRLFVFRGVATESSDAYLSRVCVAVAASPKFLWLWHLVLAFLSTQYRRTPRIA